MRFAFALSVAMIGVSAAVALEPAKVDFNRDVRPILVDKCFKCHGPGTQKSGLRLDERATAIAKEAFLPGKPAESEMLARLKLPADDDTRMPPATSGDALTAAQIATLTRWIAEGAEYTPHWSFVKPVRPTLPGGDGHPIDRFLEVKRLERSLKPAAEADRSTQIRRVTIDLIGLLPTPKEVSAYANDTSPEAYETLVDRLLASPHYGERQARHWLDLARYADSNGYTIDGARSVWPYRDWVIQSFNDDKPFDAFTIEQLAGDLLPGATKTQQIATGFHRNTSFNEEGGTDPEQFRVERTIDRANTTGAVWLGLTVGCAQCHDHKYDPVSQKDYYRLYAYFNSCEEPTIALGGSPDLEKKIAELQAKIAELQVTGDVPGVNKIKAEIKKVQGAIPTTLAIREMPKPRPTFVQIRGDFLRPGEEVQPDAPSVFPVRPAGRTRLDLAKWLVSPENPLTARVVVNRYWQQFFGRGLVETENDFGLMGKLPTHPELFDWLATEFVRLKWSTKKLHRLIVTSAAYRQSSLLNAKLLAADPRNDFLARQTRLRLDAEIIRDVALSASGSLTTKIGGPSVYPPQPREVFAFTQSNHAWPESKGPDRFRRGMYTFIWRQSQHPLLTTFDGADAQTSCTKRNRSNTPLQALHIANDPVFVELAESLGKRILKDGPTDDAGRLGFAYRICFSREPTAAESARLLSYIREPHGTPEKSWAAVARVLINLDEFIVRE